MRLRSLLPFLLLALLALPARADPVADAAVLFHTGVDRFDHKDYAGALDAFEQSRKLYPTKTVRENIAACFTRLDRFEEALTAYEELGEKDQATRLAQYVGFVRVHSAPGARVLVDGRDRTPADAPLRVTVGSRHVRVEKEGFAAYEATVTVASGETRDVTANLAVVVELGRLEVVEGGGRTIGVRVDGASVGRTPWSGAMSAGEHTVALAGDGDVGAPPRAVRITTDHTERVELLASALPASLRVEPSPTYADVSVDGAVVSRGTFASSLPSGPHAVDVAAPWYVSQHVPVVLTSTEPSELHVVLEPIKRLSVELFGGPILLPTYATINHGCSSCVGDVLGGRAGFLLTRHVAVELFFVPTMNVTSSAMSNASVFLSFGGFSAKLEFFDRTPLTLRLWGGFGSEAISQTGYWTLVAGPEVRMGYRLGKTLVVDAGIAALFFGVPATPVTSGGIGMAIPLTAGLRVDL